MSEKAKWLSFNGFRIPVDEILYYNVQSTTVTVYLKSGQFAGSNEAEVSGLTAELDAHFNPVDLSKPRPKRP